MKKITAILSIVAIILTFSVNSSKAEESSNDWLVGTSMSTTIYFGGKAGIASLINFATCCAKSNDGSACYLPSQSDVSGCNSARVNGRLTQIRFID